MDVVPSLHNDPYYPFQSRTIMSTSSAIAVKVPATTANLGPGFDCLGAALTLHNEFCFTQQPDAHPSPLTIEVTGVEAERVQRNDQNMAYRALVHFYEHIQQPIPPLHLAIHLGIPLARGLGSSATAIVGGLLGANALANSPLTPTEVLQLAIDLEGHPDNVAPALLGGCQLAAKSDSDWVLCLLDWHPTVVPILAIPDFELSTAAARSVLPQNCTYGDAIFNTAHLGLLVKGLETGRTDWLQAALLDRLHQPYRQSLIQGFVEVRQAAMSAGALGLVISGAGPTLLALGTQETAPAIATQMQLTWQHLGIQSQIKIAALDTQGAIVSRV
jgi:homoserine kinase